jgi:hypothetical protein
MKGFCCALACVWLYAANWKTSGRGNSSGNSRILYSSNASQNIRTDLKFVSVLEFLSLNEHWTKRIFHPLNPLKLNGENGMMMKGEKE